MTKNDSQRTMLLKWLIILGCPFIINLLPLNSSFTWEVRTFFVITLVGILLFIFEPFDYSVSAIIMMCGYSLSGLVTLNEVLSPFSTAVPWMIFGCIWLVNIVQRSTNLLDRIACQCMLLTGGTYTGIIYGLIILGMIINVIMPGIFTGLAVGSLAYSICCALDLGKSKASSGIMLAGLIGFLGAWNFIYCPADFGVLIGVANTAVPTSMDYLTFLLNNTIFIPFSFLMGLVIVKICKPEKEINGKEYFEERKRHLGKLTADEKKSIIILLIFIVFLFTNRWHGINMAYGFLITPALFYFPKINLGRKEDIAGANLPMIIFVVGCLSIGVVASKIGAGELIANVALPLLTQFGKSGFVFLTYVFVTLFNFIMTPMAETAAFGGIFTQMAVDMNMTQYPMLYAFSLGTRNILLPYEATMAAAYFAFGNIDMKLFVKVYGIQMILTAIWILVLACPYWSFLGLM